jgi:diguanylate cyclase (GGDEF)-like protein
VKLDLSLVQKRPDAAVAEIMNAVNAYAESTGALLLAEGIESDKHLMMARALGARLGQGWMFGRPSTSLSRAMPVGTIVFPSAPPPTADWSPFNCLPTDAPLRVSPKSLLIEISKSLERQAMRFGGTGMVVSTFQQARYFTPFTARRYRSLVDRGGFVAAIGEGLSPEPVPGLRGADLADDDPVRSEWDIVVLAPHFSAALLARDLGDKGPDRHRRFEFALTYDRTTVISAAQSLLSRVLPADWIEPEFALAVEVAAATEADGAGPVTAAPASPPSTHPVQQDQAGAFLDPLTGLLNRSRVQTLLESAQLEAQKTDGGLAIVHFEIDKFGAINTHSGHLAADVVLRTVADRLTKRFRRSDLMARLGDDEFVVLLAGLDLENAATEAQQVADGCIDSLSQPIGTQRGLINITINIGVSCYPADGNSFDTLTQAAGQRKHSSSN